MRWTDDVGGEHLDDMLFNEFPVLYICTVWMLTNRTCARLQLDAVGNTFDLTDMTRSNVLLALEYGQDMLSIVVFLNFKKVNHVTPLFWGLR